MNEGWDLIEGDGIYAEGSGYAVEGNDVFITSEGDGYIITKVQDTL